MTKLEKMAIIASLLECTIIGYFKYKATKLITKKAVVYFEEEAKQVAARQRQKFYEGMVKSE